MSAVLAATPTDCVWQVAPLEKAGYRTVAIGMTYLPQTAQFNLTCTLHPFLPG